MLIYIYCAPTLFNKVICHKVTLRRMWKNSTPNTSTRCFIFIIYACVFQFGNKFIARCFSSCHPKPSNRNTPSITMWSRRSVEMKSELLDIFHVYDVSGRRLSEDGMVFPSHISHKCSGAEDITSSHMLSKQEADVEVVLGKHFHHRKISLSRPHFSFISIFLSREMFICGIQFPASVCLFDKNDS